MSTPNTDGKKSTNHDAGGKFSKGTKASPGRTPGRSKVSELREKLAQDVDAVISIVREQALAGDPQAIRILLDRVLPSLRPVELPTPMDLPEGNLAHQAQAVVQAVADGEADRVDPLDGKRVGGAHGNSFRRGRAPRTAARRSSNCRWAACT